MTRNKMLRSRKRFGRCKVEGHGDNCFCEVCEEIQGTEFTRTQDKREWKKEVKEELEDNELNEEKTSNIYKNC